MNVPLTTVTTKGWQLYLALIVSSFCLLIPAFYNHYPLVNPDTATYLASGFKPETPFDRPITYGLLIRLLSLNGMSLWLLVFSQGYLVSWLLYRIIKNLPGTRYYILNSLLTIFFLSVGTSLSWIVSQVQPDVFTSIAFLCIIIILMDKERGRTRGLLYVIFYIAVAVHLSHPLLMVMLLLSLLVFSRVYTGKAGLRPVKKICTLLGLSLAGIALMGSALAKSKHVFFMGSLLEKGVLKKYLDDNCATKNYKLCLYINVLPVNGDEFMWNPESPLYKIGSWQGTRSEFNDIIYGILSNPVYSKLYISATVKQAGQQAITFNIGDGNVSFPDGTNVHQRITEYFPGEENTFNNAVQNNKQMPEILTLPNKLFTIIIVCSLLGIGYVFTKWNRLSKEIRVILIVCIAGVLLNCLDCAAFGIVNGRYGCKVIWLIPFCVMAFVTMSSSLKQKFPFRG
jgi:hypothetical protein